MAEYRSNDAKKYQEVITPPELVAKIMSHLKPEDLTGDILDPCVGPGAMIEPFLKTASKITVMDIQKEHIDNFKKKYNIK